jgi:hypothetical protein
MTDTQRALLAALDDEEWRRVGYRLGPFTPGDAEELIWMGLAEHRPRERKPGAHEYRRTAAARTRIKD